MRRRFRRLQLTVFFMLAVLCLVHAADAATQTLILAPGWNWVSFNVLPTSHKVGDVLGLSGFTANDVIVTNGTMSRFAVTNWLPASFTVEYGKLYQIYVDKAVTVTVSGDACKLWYLPLTTGWNWIADLTFRQAVAPADLTHDNGWAANDRIQAAGGSNVVYMNGKWIPASFRLEPGKGYQIYTANDGTLVYPDEEEDRLYVVVDLSGGPNAISYPVRYSNSAPNLDDDTCRTTELWLRRIPAGTFTMGSPADEVGRSSSETQHQVTLTLDYYIGVFECTQKQWELIMGNNPSNYKGDCRPVEQVIYGDIRGDGAQTGAGWPTYGHEVDASSFMGKLQAKTGLMFDLPTEAQWEYACRADTTTALNSGKNLSSTGQDANMTEVGRYYYNRTDGKGGYSQHTKVGSYLRNAWGLYDMHGNVLEWCLDWYSGYGTVAVSDPVGSTSGSHRVIRGGGWSYYANRCRSAYRDYCNPSYIIVYDGDNINSGIGFRVLCLP